MQVFSDRHYQLSKGVHQQMNLTHVWKRRHYGPESITSILPVTCVNNCTTINDFAKMSWQIGEGRINPDANGKNVFWTIFRVNSVVTCYIVLIKNNCFFKLKTIIFSLLWKSYFSNTLYENHKRLLPSTIKNRSFYMKSKRKVFGYILKVWLQF